MPDPPLEDAQWEDDERRPRTASELTGAFERTWAMIDESLRRWTTEDLAVEFSRTRRNGEVETFTRTLVVWHLIEHDLHHGGEISQILGTTTGSRRSNSDWFCEGTGMDRAPLRRREGPCGSSR